MTQLADAGEGSAGSTEKKAGDRRKRMTSGDELADFLQNVPAHACLVFIEEEIDKRIKYVKLIEKYGLIVEFNFRMPDELTEWVMKRIKELGHETNPRAAALIVEYCEPGMDDILNEIKKLCSFAGSRRMITEEDVERVCTRSVKSRVFELTDAIAANQVARALSLLNDMEVMKEPMPKVMYMIARQFRQLIQVKLMLREGAAQSEIASHFRVQPFIARKLINQAQKFTEEKLEKAVSTGLELDLSVKTGRLDSKAAVELMITSLSG
ncbi:MAG: DNA polymerase III subunit delta [Acetivibrionales bacterium]